MNEHFEKIRFLYGDDAMIRLPNNIFRVLSTSIRNKNGDCNSQQVAFSYAYLIAVGFLYKFAHFVDSDTNTYVQNNDLKQLLGYSKTTKSIDIIIKKDGVLDSLKLLETKKDYPLFFNLNHEEMINRIPLREFTMLSHLDSEDSYLKIVKSIVKNRNYEVKEPLYLTTGNDEEEYGTLYNIKKTHGITIREFMKFVEDEELDNTHLLIYGFLKSRCKGYPDNMNSLTLYKTTGEIGIDKTTFGTRIKFMENRNYISVSHKKWKRKQEHHIDMDANDYYFHGI